MIKNMIKLSISIFLICIIIGCIPAQEGNPVEHNGRILFQSIAENRLEYFQIFPNGSQLQKADVLSDMVHASETFGIIPSPNSENIAYSANYDGNFEIYVVDLKKGQTKNITQSNGNEYSFSWAPDAKRIAFISDRDSVLMSEENDLWTNDLFIVNLEDDSIQKISKNNTQNQYGTLSWSPDGNYLVFNMSTLSPFGPFVSNIYKLDLRTHESFLLTNPSDSIYYRPAWAPDGKKIMYFQNRGGLITLLTINADGTSKTVLMNGDFGYLENAIWAPDGDKVLVSVKKGNQNLIYTVNADGSCLKNLSTIENRIDSNPSWSPDGKQIVFSSRLSDENNQLFIMNVDGSDRRALTDSSLDANFPIWLVSP